MSKDVGVNCLIHLLWIQIAIYCIFKVPSDSSVKYMFAGNALKKEHGFYSGTKTLKASLDISKSTCTMIFVHVCVHMFFLESELSVQSLLKEVLYIQIFFFVYSLLRSRLNAYFLRTQFNMFKYRLIIQPFKISIWYNYHLKP